MGVGSWEFKLITLNSLTLKLLDSHLLYTLGTLAERSVVIS